MEGKMPLVKSESELSDIPESLKDKFEDLALEEYLVAPEVTFEVPKVQKSQFLHPMHNPSLAHIKEEDSVMESSAFYDLSRNFSSRKPEEFFQKL